MTETEVVERAVEGVDVAATVEEVERMVVLVGGMVVVLLGEILEVVEFTKVGLGVELGLPEPCCGYSLFQHVVAIAILP